MLAVKCGSCAAEVSPEARFCPACGTAISSHSQMPTGLATPSEARAAVRRTPSASAGRISAGSLAGEGFAPGTVLAERYRIIGLLGRGGMGEVYRADDLKLGQAVALKFLPERLASDPAWIERFYAEVRHARQVSHPNVCRVYDVGEIEGRHYLSMEYVDGEDLASLLRRIGRLGPDKALEIARQLCAGLAAAHDKGVLHRDLKPANVMVDGRGRARITDFGLAVGADEETREGELSGTPAYMSPEQLAGRPATAQSDLYALGLVLYELFTGKRALEATTIAEWRRKHGEEPPPAPSSVVREMDPIVERVILRCLEKDPRARPRSALALAHALPGGDPLAAALAAGETPSPEMVAASGEAGGLKPLVAWTLLSFVLLGLVAGVLLIPRVALHGAVPLEKTPDALIERSRAILNRVGYVEKPADSAFAFEDNGDYLRYVEKNDRSPARWEDMGDGRPAGIYFWYRQSARSLVATDFFGGPFNGHVRLDDPKPSVPGMALVIVDTLGRLLKLEVVPPERSETRTTAPASPNWAGLFEEAGLDFAKFSEVSPEWLPSGYADARTAWVERPESGRLPLRVEAAALGGRPTSFELIGPWGRPRSMRSAAESSPEAAAGDLIALTIFLGVLLGSVLIARRNVRVGRGDRRGAFRIAGFVFAAFMFAWTLAADHVASFYEIGLFLMMVSWTLLVSGMVWVMYMALEPFVRRRWPQTVVSWTRLLSGRFRDPQIGRDVLIGAALGVVGGLLTPLSHLVRGWIEGVPPRPAFVFLFPFRGARSIAGDLVLASAIGLFFVMGFFTLLFLLRLLLRNEWLAGAAAAVLLSLSDGFAGSWVNAAFTGLFVAALAFVTIRFGILAAAFSFYFNHYFQFPLRLDGWYAGYVLFPLIVLAALAVFGFRTALAGRPAFGPLKLED